MKKEITNRDDISLLLHTFYSKIRADKEIGHFFNETISNWDSHLEKLTDFWESTLFGVRKYQGNPLIAHVEVDRKFGNTVSVNEFGLWLNLWFETLDELFEGENVDVLKQRARKMGTHLNLAIFGSRSATEKID